jgi:hypothetical protein
MDHKVVKDNELPADLDWLSVLHQFWCTEFWGGSPTCGRGTPYFGISVGDGWVIFCKGRRQCLRGSVTKLRSPDKCPVLSSTDGLRFFISSAPQDGSLETGFRELMRMDRGKSHGDPRSRDEACARKWKTLLQL